MPGYQNTMYCISGKILMLTVGFYWLCLKCRHSPLAEITSSVEAFPCGFISWVKKEKKTLGVHCFLSAEFLSWKSPEWRTTALFLQSRLTAARPAWCPQLVFSLVFIDIARPSFGKLIGFVWVMRTIDRKYKLITNCEIFNGAIEDTKRGRGWRLMEQRLPSVSSQQSDLLITHYFEGFF